MLERIRRQQDYYAGAFIMLIGAAGLVIGRQYAFGSLRSLGPGFLPMLLSASMIGIGALIALQAKPSEARAADETAGLEHPEWRGWACILGGVLLFVLLAKPAGMVPATFVCVFVSAMGDRTATLRASAILAAIIAVVGVLVFHYGLQIQLQPFGR